MQFYYMMNEEDNDINELEKKGFKYFIIYNCFLLFLLLFVFII